MQFTGSLHTVVQVDLFCYIPAVMTFFMITKEDVYCKHSNYSTPQHLKALQIINPDSKSFLNVRQGQNAVFDEF